MVSFSGDNEEEEKKEEGDPVSNYRGGLSQISNPNGEVRFLWYHCTFSLKIGSNLIHIPLQSCIL